MTVRNQKIRVTQHGTPDPQLSQKAYERLISNIIREYEEKGIRTPSLVAEM